ncbi:hypothetical protein [Mucilaginibacter gossypiicola]|uniref:hypothetical protein n=1 Tax=Mucilaginibacter gossypiicola TaxID=551995 RepID=UPI000B85A68E|nr:hypothetical protein [Mucilaginibacter gossypiicola]
MEANYQNRVYYFNIVDRKSDGLSIKMCNTIYNFIKKGEQWQNHLCRRMEMKKELIAAVMSAAGEV